MRIGADWDRCESNGVCVGIAPDIFALDDDDNLQFSESEVPAGRVEAVLEAIAQCPKAALFAIDD